MRKSLFQRLEPWNGLRVCDLYAGIGSVGIEALSRGANRVTFVENSQMALSVLRTNLDRIAAQNTTVIDADVHEYLQSSTETFDVVLADPPYGTVQWDQLHEICLPLLNDGGIFVMEMARQANLPQGLDVRTYGKSKVAIRRHV